MEDKKIPGYVHLFKISIGNRLLFNEVEENVYHFITSQGMNASIAGLKKFINEIENSKLVKLKTKNTEKNSGTIKCIGETLSLTQEVDVFVAKKDLPSIENVNETHFICYADSYMDSIDEFVEILALAIA